LDAESVYWITNNGNGGQVLKCAKGGCAGSATQLATGRGNLGGIAVDSSGVYWTETQTFPGGKIGPTAAAAPGAVFQCAMTGCNNAPTLIASDQNHPTGIAVDAVNIYWANSGSNKSPDGAIMVVAKATARN
jgi:hypothetical protein